MKKFIAALLVVMIVVSLSACALPGRSVVGTWSGKTSVLGIVTDVTYTFNEDGTGSKDNVLEVAFTYETEDGKLYITTSALGIEYTEEYDYEFSSGNLILSADGESITLEKVK